MVMNHRSHRRRPKIVKGIAAILPMFLFCLPFIGNAADPTPATSSSASAPTESILSAALFSGTSPAPTEDAWRSATEIKGVRIGYEARRRLCTVKHVAEWVRIQCTDLNATRVDLVAGEKRDLKFIKTESGYSMYGENVAVQFSMRPGDRRVLHWIMPDVWWYVWDGDEGKMASGFQPMGPMFGLMVQIDWASGSEPIISVY
jgi:hypothetical protein